MSSNEDFYNKIGSIDVVHFDRNSNKKCRNPKIREKLSDLLRAKESEKKFESIEKCLEEMPTKFGKKDIATGIQKAFDCLSCKCLIQSPTGLLAHLKGEKHVNSIATYKPQ